ncbi:hypothetical protein RCL1_003522 [Eukaryota sp. TZLM3-RCL]
MANSSTPLQQQNLFNYFPVQLSQINDLPDEVIDVEVEDPPFPDSNSDTSQTAPQSPSNRIVLEIPVSGRLKTSKLWNFFMKNDDKYCCNVGNCGAKYSMNTGQCTLSKHLKTVHKFDDDLSPPTAWTKPVSSYLNPSESEVSSNEINFERLTTLLTVMAIKDDLPFTFVESESLYNVFKELNPSVTKQNLPGRRTIARRAFQYYEA